MVKVRLKGKEYTITEKELEVWEKAGNIPYVVVEIDKPKPLKEKEQDADKSATPLNQPKNN